MRTSRIVMGIALALTLAGCGRSQAAMEAEAEELQGQLSQAQEELEKATGQLEEARSEAGELADAVGRFESEDWADVVPNVKDEADQVVRALEER